MIRSSTTVILIAFVIAVVVYILLQIKSALINYGAISRVIVDQIHGRYAIVEFEDEQSAKKALDDGTVNISNVSTCICKKRLLI